MRCILDSLSLNKFFSKLSLCAIAGALVGFITGSLLFLIQAMEGPLVFSIAHAFEIGIAFGLLGWIFVLVVIGLWERYRISSIALPSLVSAIIVSLVTVFIENEIPGAASVFFPFIGEIVGLVIGTYSCKLCSRYTITQPQPVALNSKAA